MIDLRWQLPDAPLRASVVTAKAFGLVAVVVLASMIRAGLHLGQLYPLKAGAVFAGTMLLAIGFVREHHPFARFGAANETTTARVMLVALVVSFIGEPRLPVVAASAAAAALVVTVLDGADGWLARRSRMASDFGARFDMETDALLVMALAILVWQYGKAGPWVLLCGLLRYLFVALGYLWPWLRRPLPPSRRRQTICIVQVVGLSLVIVPAIGPPVSGVMAGVALSALCYSFLVDVAWLWRHAGVGFVTNSTDDSSCPSRLAPLG
jgi:phosphatidylglycerophosphate synthase